jgi:SAM-dependent methyltransferase
MRTPAKPDRKRLPLRTADLQSFSMNPEIIRLLEGQRARLALAPSQMRVLDFGCGRGEYTAWLRAQGYEAYGVEIDEGVLANGRPYFESLGLDGTSVLRQAAPDGALPFPDAFFHFVCSEQVLEHVRDLEQAARELARVSAPGAGGLHCYPGRWRPIEVHLFMPLVHWLPPGGLRRACIRACVALGIEPRWQHLAGLDRAARAHAYWLYSVERTHYRGCRAVRAIFERQGFRIRFVTIEHVAIERRRALARLLRVPGIRGLASWLLLQFKLVELATQRGHAANAAAQTRPEPRGDAVNASW